MSDTAPVETVCRSCEHSFAEQPRSVAGLLLFRCPVCRRRVIDPLTRGWRVVWWIIALLTSVGVVASNVLLSQGYSWIPAGVGLLSLVVLCVDVALRHRVDRARLRAGLVGDRPVAASPGYVAVLTVTVFTTALASVGGAAVVAGLNGGYTTVVVDRAQAAPLQDFQGLDLVVTDHDICTGGQDYWACTSMHNTMWNTVCTRPLDLTVPATSSCANLREFIDGAWARYQTCGYGCETRASDDGNWGWNILRPEPVVRRVSQPAITHVETCYFVLGPVRIGYCPEE